MVIVAHAGHWIVQVLYVAPLAVFVSILVRTKLKERREREALGPDAEAGRPAAAGHEQ